MRGKWILIFLLLLPIAYANLEITPNPYSDNLFVDIEKNLQITLKNTHDFPIYNINFSPMDYVSMDIVPYLDVNESLNVNMTVLTDTSFSTKTFNSVVKYWYASQIDIDPVIHTVNITNESFVPEEISIRKGDSIKFSNLQEVFASIRDDYSPSEYFDVEIQPDQSATFSTFNKIDDFTYTDWNLWKKGRIIILNDTLELINNPDFNKVFTLTYDSKYTASVLQMEVYPTNNLTVEYNEVQEVSIRVWNDGNTTIHNVTLEADEYKNWFTYEENNFDLTSNQNKFIDLQILPQINESENTNKTYEIDIRARAENADSITTLLRIFVPYEADIIDFGNLTREQLVEQLRNLKEFLETLDLEDQEETVKIVYLNSTLELTKEEVIKTDREQNTRLSQIESQQEKQTKSMNTVETTIQGFEKILTNVTSLLVTYNDIADKARKKAEDTELNFYLVILLMLVIATLFTLIYRLKKKKEMRIMETHP